MILTDYVLDEACTLAKAWAGSEAALRLRDALATDRHFVEAGFHGLLRAD